MHIPLDGRSQSTPSQRIANRVAYVGWIHAREIQCRYWICASIGPRVQRQLASGRGYESAGDSFTKSKTRDAIEIQYLLNACADTLSRFLHSNIGTKPSRLGRDDHISALVVMRDAKRIHSDLYDSIEVKVRGLYGDTGRSWRHELGHLECIRFIDNKLVDSHLISRSLEDDLVTHLFLREMILVRLGLFEQVSFPNFTEVVIGISSFRISVLQFVTLIFRLFVVQFKLVQMMIKTRFRIDFLIQRLSSQCSMLVADHFRFSSKIKSLKHSLVSSTLPFCLFLQL